MEFGGNARPRGALEYCFRVPFAVGRLSSFLSDVPQTPPEKGEAGFSTQILHVSAQTLVDC